MKKIYRHSSKFYKPVRLYRDDLDAIFNIFKHETKSFKILIGDYELDDYNDIEDLKDKYLTNLDIRSTEPNISLSFTDRTISIHLDNNDVLSLGCCHKIEEILSQNSIFYLKHYLLITLVLYFTLYALCFIIFKNPLSIYTSSAVALTFMGFIFIDIKFRLIKHSKIYLNYKKDTPGFITRNFDKIVLSIFATIFGILIKFCFDKFVT